MDIDKLLASIAVKLRPSGEEKVRIKVTRPYKDEPLNRTTQKEKNSCPQRITDMKAIAENQENLFLSKSRLFYKQAVFMADYEDSFPAAPFFNCYYPTYKDMTDDQLRYYFTWRTALRRGEYKRIGTSYVFVYIYELLSLVGTEGAEDAFDKLWQLHKCISEDSFEPEKILYHLSRWMTDFVAYYGLDPALLEKIGFLSAKTDSAIAVLQNGSDDTEEIWGALVCISSYNVLRSKLYAGYPERFKRVAVGTYLSMREYFLQKRKTTYPESLIGPMRTEGPFSIFEGAVFCAEEKKNYEYAVSPVRVYRTLCTGAWYKSSYSLEGGKSKRTGALLRTVDRIIREETAFDPPLKNEESTKLLSSTVRAQLKAVLLSEAEEEKHRRLIRIDMGALSTIRKVADINCERLLTEEDVREDEPIAPITEKANVEKEEGMLSKAEEEFLLTILNGDRYSGSGTVSLLCDSINEKLFDSFSDTVIDFAGDEPYVIEDYTEELKEMLL